MKRTFNLLVLVTLLALVFTAIGAPATSVRAAAMDFQILSLTANNPVLYLNHDPITGDDRGGIAVSTSKVFYSGDNATGSWNLADLSGATTLGVLYDGLASNLNTGDVYTLGTASGAINAAAPDTITRLLAINGSTGALTGGEITLSSPITVSPTGYLSITGIFSGYDRVLIHNSTDVYEIALPSGTVTHLGSLAMPTHSYCENWAYWGVAEHFGGADYIAYVQDTNTIVRMRVSDGAVSTIASFTSLHDMCSFTITPSTNRWYFHHEYDSQFATGVNELLGYADATFSVGAPSDTTPPVVTVPADITAEATSAAGAVVNFSASATDETSPANPAVSCALPSGSTFPIGTTPVTCSATDDAMNTGYGYFNITVQDTTDPLTTLDTYPPSLTNSTSATITFHAEDAVSAPANITSYCDTGSGWNPCTSPVNLSGLSDGLHTIWIYSVDQAGNSEWAPVLNAVYSWTVDTTIPNFGLSFIGPYEATGPSGAVAAYSVGFTDANGIASQSCSPASGSLFPIGSTQVNCTAIDNAGNIANAFFYLVVQDTTDPIISLPADITVPQTSPAGAVVNYLVTAADTVDASPTISCSLPSGMTYPVGTTTVNCSATDDYGNTANGSFDITVLAWTPATFTSLGAYDGTIFETTENSGVGGAPNISGGFLDVGDMTLDRQVMGLMHFDTSSLPDGAQVLGLTLQLKRYQFVGTDPFTLLGNLSVDIASPYFGTEMAFRQGDFQAAASEANVGIFNPAPLNWYEANLGASAFPYLNLTGATQFRLHFTLDDNDDLQNDFIRFFSGNAPIAGYRPVLVVYYYIP